jgi:hypothetical protein
VTEDEEAKKRGFEIIDKRGQSNSAVVDRVPEPKKEENPPVQDRKWKSVGYVIVVNQDPQKGLFVMGRAAGLATDENTFVADYLFGMRWEAGFDWTIDAKRRLDSFLQCPCSPQTGPCPYHRRMAPQGWLKEDMDRIREDGLRAVPEVIEILAKAERARMQATRILAPRR